MKQPCACCTGIESLIPKPAANRPGLDAIAYRAGTHARFMESMLARLSSLYLDIPAADGSGKTFRIYPLQNLTTRDPADPAIALLDGWATVADVLSFYQERIANEGYLRTASERRSVLELARLVGYRLRPGVASSVYLAFTVAAGFKGNLPLGSRAQSQPGEGEKPQFFETSEVLPARDVWNTLKPRLTRPQVFTPPARRNSVPLVTGADVADTVYLDGIGTQLKTGDALLFTFGAVEPVLRKIEAVNAQAEQKRTEAILAQSLPGSDLSAIQTGLQVFIDKAGYLFPGSDVAQDVAAVLSALIDNFNQTGLATSLTIAAAAQIREQQDLALTRGFTRVAAWISHVLQFLRALGASGFTDGEGGITLKRVSSPLETSPLANLGAAIGRLALAPSLQPANSQRLARSVAQSFAPQSDTAPRLLAAFKPAAAATLYQAWSRIEAPPSRVEVLALRVKATFFASGHAGAAQIRQTFPQGNNTATTSATVFTPPTLPVAWRSLAADFANPEFQEPLDTLPLDAAYEQIRPGSWAVIDRPAFSANGAASGRAVSYHTIRGVRTSTMDTGSGHTAKVTLIDIEPPWPTSRLVDGTVVDDRPVVLNSGDDFFQQSTSVLRNTIIYTQAEGLDLAEEPLDTDVEQDSISLQGILDGIEPGRWIIVSGNRTDVPNVSAVTASELAMVAAVAQGLQEPYSAAFPAGLMPFAKHYYTTSANAFGDRLVVGKATPATLAAIRRLAPPARANQKYRDQVQLAAGLYANAYVPTPDEIRGDFHDFEGLLVDPDSGIPIPGGNIQAEMKTLGLFAWRISAGQVQTLLSLAQPLAYRYDTRTVTIYGNVVKATQGQTVGEILGDGDASLAFQTFALQQTPLTYVSAPTPAGAASSLNLRVNEVDWQEQDSLNGAGPVDHAFMTETDEAGLTSVVFGNGAKGARLPTGSANVKAVYRYGMGKVGNVKARQINQLASHPPGAQEVINPLPASGGADPDSRDQARRNAPLAVMALDRLVSVKDYADFARTYAGIGKASAARISDGRRLWLHLSIAGVADAPIDRNADLYRNLVQSLQDFGDPALAVQVGVRRIKLLVISAGVKVAPGHHWETVSSAVQAGLLDTFSFEQRELGQAAFQSEAVRSIQGIEGVAYADLNVFDSVAEDIGVAELAALGGSLGLRRQVEASLARLGPDVPDPARRILPAELVFLSPDIPATLILTEISG